MSRVLADIFKAHDAQWLGVRCLYLGPYLQGTMTLSRPPKFEPLTLFYFNPQFFCGSVLKVDVDHGKV